MAAENAAEALLREAPWERVMVCAQWTSVVGQAAARHSRVVLVVASVLELLAAYGPEWERQIRARKWAMRAP